MGENLPEKRWILRSIGDDDGRRERGETIVEIYFVGNDRRLQWRVRLLIDRCWLAV